MGVQFGLLPEEGAETALGLRLGRRTPPDVRALAPPENFRGGVSPMRGTTPDHTGVPDKPAANIYGEL